MTQSKDFFTLLDVSLVKRLKTIHLECHLRIYQWLLSQPQSRGFYIQFLQRLESNYRIYNLIFSVTHLTYSNLLYSTPVQEITITIFLNFSSKLFLSSSRNLPFHLSLHALWIIFYLYQLSLPYSNVSISITYIWVDTNLHLIIKLTHLHTHWLNHVPLVYRKDSILISFKA